MRLPPAQTCNFFWHFFDKIYWQNPSISQKVVAAASLLRRYGVAAVPLGDSAGYFRVIVQSWVYF